MRRPGCGPARRVGFRGVGGGPAPAPAEWSPLLLTNVRGWYRSDLGVTLDDLTGDVDTWADQTGNGNHLTAPSASNQPAYNPDGGPNDVPSLDWNGTDSHYLVATYSWGGDISALSVIMIGRGLVYNNGDRWFDYRSGQVIISDGLSASKWRAARNTASQSTSDTTGIDAVRVYRWDGASQDVVINGTTEDTDANANIAPLDLGTLSIGASNAGGVPAGFRLYELIHMRAFITGDELASLMAYAAARYGL